MSDNVVVSSSDAIPECCQIRHPEKGMEVLARFAPGLWMRIVLSRPEPSNVAWWWADMVVGESKIPRCHRLATMKSLQSHACSASSVASSMD